MDILNSKVYRGFEVAINLVLLNLLWLLVCVPIVTIFPATAAMYGVVREWSKDTDSGSVLPFVRHLRANFRQSFVLGLLWLALTFLLVIDFVAINGADDWIKAPLFVLLGLVAFFDIITTIYIFPVMVNYEGRLVTVIKNSFLIAVSQPLYTLLGLLWLFVVLSIMYYVPPTVLIAGSGTAYIFYKLCRRAFDKVEAMKGIDLTDTQKPLS